MDWVKFDLADEWHKKRDDPEAGLLLAKEIMNYWFTMCDQHPYVTGRYRDIYGEWFHDGMRAAEHLRSVIKLIEEGDRQVTIDSLWFPMRNVTVYLRYTQAFDELLTKNP